MKIGRGTWMAAALLAGTATAGASGDVRVPRALPAMPDLGTQAPVIVKMPAAERPALAASAPAAEPSPAARTASPIAAVPRPSTVVWSADGRQTLWARGTTYKCSFGTDGATFVPFLGAAAPRNHPVQFRLAHVAAGGVPIEFDADVAAVRSGDKISFDRGAIVEVYDTALESVEQSFVIERLPNRGELALRIAVESDLSPAESADDVGGLEFRGELGTVRYGRATVVDAAGRSATASTKLAPGGIEIRVPADFLAQAELPVTIDPVVSRWAIDNAPMDAYAPDVAYDATTKWVMTVFEQTFSAADHDVIASVRYDDGGYRDYLVIDGSSENWSAPKIANNNAAHDFLVVAQAGPTGAREIKGQIVLAQTLFQSAIFTISGPETGEKLDPTVGGDPSPIGPSYFCVAWERVRSLTDHDIHARLVDPYGLLHGPGTIMVDNTLGTLDQNPELSKNDGLPPTATQAWTVVWQRHAGPGDEDIHGAQLAWDGWVMTPPFEIDISSENSLNPRVSPILDRGLGERWYLVAWQRVVNVSHWAISLSVRGGASQYMVGDLNAVEGNDPAPDKILPALDSDGGQFALSYTIWEGNGLAEVRLSNVYVSGAELGVSDRGAWVSVGQGVVDMRQRIASVHGSGGSGHDHFLSWDHLDTSQSTQHEILGARYTAPVGGPYSQFCFGSAACPCTNNGANGGCANSANPGGAVLTATGGTSVSDDSFVLHGSGMPASSFCIYMQGTTSHSPVQYGDGKRCIGGSMTRLKAKNNVGGMSQYPAQFELWISIRGNVPMLGATRAYQVLYRDPANYCTAATFNISNGIEAVWTP